MLRTQAMDISQILAITREFYPLTFVYPITRLFIEGELQNFQLPTDVVVSRYQENLPSTHPNPGKSSLKTQRPTHQYSIDLVL